MRNGDVVSFRGTGTDKSLATQLPHLASLTVHTHSMCPKCLLLKDCKQHTERKTKYTQYFNS